ncbi:MAG: DUF4160 domain-containing protein [Atopobiaceae bacterium]|nr:DUF4160 domain-containing protein [Atopobiaceae bacterium]
MRKKCDVIFGLSLYFWSDESHPLEPIHVHVSQGTPRENATKIWITSTGHCLLANNRSDIPARQLRLIMKTVEAHHQAIEEQWFSYFGELSYYC